MRIYIATAGDSHVYRALLVALRRAGHQPYDCMHPAPGSDPTRPPDNPEARDSEDWNALIECEACVLLLPADNLGYLEAGFAAGDRRPLYIIGVEKSIPSILHDMCTKVFLDSSELIEELGEERFGTYAYTVPQDAATCRVCGCWDGQACPGGCYWVEPDLCSECAPKTETPETDHKGDPDPSEIA